MDGLIDALVKYGLTLKEQGQQAADALIPIYDAQFPTFKKYASGISILIQAEDYERRRSGTQ